MALPSMLKGLPDMERGITRIFHRTANPAEFVQVLQALVNIAPQLGVQVRMHLELLVSSCHRCCLSSPQESLHTLWARLYIIVNIASWFYHDMG